MTEKKEILKDVEDLLKHVTPPLPEPEVQALVNSFLDRRADFLATMKEWGSPLYVFDKDALVARAGEFVSALGKTMPNSKVFFAVKSNNHPLVMRTLVDCGLGLDVSSGLELTAALSTGCSAIVFSGPGKTETELELAVAHPKRVTVLVDSFGELDRLEKVAATKETAVRVGVRLTTTEQGLWRKFGVPLASLKLFLERAGACAHVSLRGLQFHTSWNLSPQAQVEFIARLGAVLKGLPEEQRATLCFLDIGGGYWPPAGEWLQPAGTAAGRLRHLVMPVSFAGTDHYKLEAQPIEAFAKGIQVAFDTHILPLVKCEIYTEPGRWLSNEAMHLVMTVVDKKADDLIITDAGTNLIGWERFESDYFPVINLSRPAEKETACMIMGSLCTPHDVWGRGYFGKGVEPGDILLIPNQGAYTYSLRQQFIKPVAEVVPLKKSLESEEGTWSVRF